MKKTYTVNQIIERVKDTKPFDEDISIETLQSIFTRFEKDRKLLEALQQEMSPIEIQSYVLNYVRQNKEITASEKDILEDALIQAKIGLGEYEKASILLRNKLTKEEFSDIDYLYLDDLILSQRKLGNLKQAKLLAMATITTYPKNCIRTKNELIHILLMEGNKKKAQTLIKAQEKFYNAKKKLKTMEYETYKKDEEETKKLKEQLNEEKEQNYK